MAASAAAMSSARSPRCGPSGGHVVANRGADITQPHRTHRQRPSAGARRKPPTDLQRRGRLAWSKRTSVGRSSARARPSPLGAVPARCRFIECPRPSCPASRDRRSTKVVLHHCSGWPADRLTGLAMDAVTAKGLGDVLSSRWACRWLHARASRVASTAWSARWFRRDRAALGPRERWASQSGIHLRMAGTDLGAVGPSRSNIPPRRLQAPGGRGGMPCGSALTRAFIFSRRDSKSRSVAAPICGP